MSEANKRLVRHALDEVYGRGNLDLADELFHPEFVDYDAGHDSGTTGPDSVKQTVERLRAAFGDLRFDVHDEIAEGDRVVQRITMQGHQTGPLMGSEPTGREFAVQHVYIWRIADARIIEHWGSRDDLGLLQQLGLLAGP